MINGNRATERIQGIGKVIFVERKKQGLTQKQLADRVEMSHSYISQVERGLIIPSLSVLRELSVGLNIPMSALFDSYQRSGKLSRRIPLQIVRKEERLTLIHPGSTAKNELLLPEFNINFSITWITFPPHSKTKPIGNWMLNGQFHAVVVSGEIVFNFCSESYILKRGDAFLYDVSMDHDFANEKDEIAELILYTMPDL